MTSSVLTNIFSEQKVLKNTSATVRVKKNRVYLFYIRVAAAATLMQVHKSFSCERPIEVSEWKLIGSSAAAFAALRLSQDSFEVFQSLINFQPLSLLVSGHWQVAVTGFRRPRRRRRLGQLRQPRQWPPFQSRLSRKSNRIPFQRFRAWNANFVT